MECENIPGLSECEPVVGLHSWSADRAPARVLKFLLWKKAQSGCPNFLHFGLIKKPGLKNVSKFLRLLLTLVCRVRSGRRWECVTATLELFWPCYVICAMPHIFWLYWVPISSGCEHDLYVPLHTPHYFTHVLVNVYPILCTTTTIQLPSSQSSLLLICCHQLLVICWNHRNSSKSS